MKKYLVLKENSENLYHVFTAEGNAKNCKPSSENSLCGRVAAMETNSEDPLVSCLAGPGTMALLSRTEEPVCARCVSFI
ncbi:MAG: hypothetical protein ABUK01_19345 [Leptospirales bacterium]